MKNNTFRRTEYNSRGRHVSAGTYNCIIGLVLFWGFAVNWWMVREMPFRSIEGLHPLALILGYFVSCFIGVLLFTRSSTPLFSFIGYNFVVVPFGFIIHLVVSRYNPEIVLYAVRITGLVTLGMMLLGSLFPVFFKRVVGALTIALIIVIIVEVVDIYIFKKHHGILDWFVAVIFCGYIGYDWGRANRIPKTVDNAVDSAASLYMDIINLFLRILRIFGRR
jgi:FtsH-binding integral membrane protein